MIASYRLLFSQEKNLKEDKTMMTLEFEISTSEERLRFSEIKYGWLGKIITAMVLYQPVIKFTVEQNHKIGIKD